jgi:prepilin-type N-terminal cleavage/methylation domain-containing protein/prepilin-type processing-associated H-X9-DG protein
MLNLIPSKTWLQRKPVLARSGFTILELLAVVVILSIIAGLLSTALNQARGKANQVTCLNNLRQLHYGWFLYAYDNNDELPLNQTVAGANSVIFGRRNASNSWVVGNPREDETAANIVKGTLFPYIRSVDVYRCPADNGSVLTKKSVSRTRSYSMSAYMNGDEAGTDPRVKSKYAEVANTSPDRIFVFIEEDNTSSWAGSFVVAPREKFSLASTANSSTPGNWHKNGCNLSFADGHIEYWKWYSSKKRTSGTILTLGNNEMRDLKRLQDSVPKP